MTRYIGTKELVEGDIIRITRIKEDHKNLWIFGYKNEEAISHDFNPSSRAAKSVKNLDFPREVSFNILKGNSISVTLYPKN